MRLAKSHGMGQQQQQGAMLTGVVYAIAAAQLMKMIYVSSAHQATNTANIDSASSLYHDYVSLHFITPRRTRTCTPGGGKGGQRPGLLRTRPALWRLGAYWWAGWAGCVGVGRKLPHSVSRLGFMRGRAGQSPATEQEGPGAAVPGDWANSAKDKVSSRRYQQSPRPKNAWADNRPRQQSPIFACANIARAGEQVGTESPPQRLCRSPLPIIACSDNRLCR